MKKEYDFSGAARGKFYRKDAKLVPPVHLEPAVSEALIGQARLRGVSLSGLVNELLKEDIRELETSAAQS